MIPLISSLSRRRVLVVVTSAITSRLSRLAGSRPRAVEREQISEDTLRQAVRDLAADDAELSIYTTDRRYVAPVPGAIDRATGAMVATSRLPYDPEVFDCEDYSGLWWALTPLMTGVNARAMIIDWSGRHAYNILVDSDGEPHLVEPQTGDHERLPVDSYYEFEHAVVIL